MILKKPKVQIHGHVQPVSVPTNKSVEEEDDYHVPQASSSNDPSIPLPTTTPTSFMPGDFSQSDQNQSPQGILNLCQLRTMMIKQNHMTLMTFLF